MPLKIRNTNFTFDFFVKSDHLHYLHSVEVILRINVLQQGEFKFHKSIVELIESEIKHS